MATVVVAIAGGTGSVWLARTARRFAVLDRLPRTRPRTRRTQVPDWARTRLARMLAAGGVSCSPEQALQVWVLAATAVGVLGLGIGPGVALAGVGAVAAGAPIGLAAWARRRDRLIADAVPALVERVASELRAGGTVATGLSRVVNTDAGLVSDLARLQARVQLGAPLPVALSAWRDERRVPGVAAAAAAFAMASTVGGRAADALEQLAASLRDRLGVAAETRALSAQARASAFVVGLGPLGYLAWTLLVDPSAVSVLVATGPGRVCLGLGLVLELAGALWMGRILARGSRL